MAKKYVNPKDIDEELIRSLVDHSQADTIPVNDPQPDMPQQPLKVVIRESNPLIIKPTIVSDYRETFFRPSSRDNLVIFRLEAQTRRKLNIVYARLNSGQTTFYGFVDNILQHHLETYKDQINDLSKNHSDIL